MTRYALPHDCPGDRARLARTPPCSRAAAADHREGSVRVRLGRRPADLARRLAGRLRARHRRREEGRLRHRDLDREDRRQRAAARDHERHPRHQPALVARRPAARLRARGREGRPAAAAADPRHGDGRRRALGHHRHAARRRQSRVVARRQDASPSRRRRARRIVTRRAKPAGDKPRESDVRVITEAVYRANGVAGVGFVDRDRPSHIWTVAVPGDRQREAGDAEAAHLRRVRRGNHRWSRRRLARLLRLGSAAGAVLLSARQRPLFGRRRTAASRRASPASTARIGAYALSPDGKRVAFVGTLAGAARALVHAARPLGRRSRRRHAAQPHGQPTTSTSTAASAAISARRAVSCPSGPVWSRDGRTHLHRRRRAGQRQPQARRRRQRHGSIRVTTGNTT